MKFLEKIRNRTYWFKDLLKGSRVSRIKNEVDILWQQKNHVVDQSSPMNRLLTHAIQTVPIYKNLNAANLKMFPVLSKTDIREKKESHISDLYSKESLKKVTTSGSTGVPFEVFQDKDKINRNTGDTISFAEKAGFTLGTPLIYLKIWNEHNAKSPFMQFLENVYPLNVINLSPNTIKDYLSFFSSRFSRVSFLGYASALEEFAKYIINNKIILEYQVDSVITMSEGLDTRARKLLKKAFSTNNVYSRYSNVENGIIAQQFDDTDRFMLNTLSYHIEILDDNGKELPEGENGRIVITDLFNFGMPIIRYDTGDYGSSVRMRVNGVERVLLENVGGRKMDSIYSSEGDLLSSFIITNGMWDYPELEQYQFVQHTLTDYEFILNINGKFKREEELVNQFTSILGHKANIKISYVDEIPLLSSGKRKKVRNNMENNKLNFP